MGKDHLLIDKSKEKTKLRSNETIEEGNRMLIIRKKRREYCNKLKLQKKGAKQYRTTDSGKNLDL